MANEKCNKVVFGNETLIDLTDDTAVESKVLSGYYFHRADGERVEGTCAFSVDASGATATAAEVLSSKTFGKGSQVLTGEMPNIGAQVSTIDDKDDSISISQGYHDGSGNVTIDSTEKAKITPGNIKDGVSILGVTGTYSGGTPSATTGSATPTRSSQTILPQSPYDYFSQFTVNAIPYTETVNAAGGKTVTIAGV